MSQISF